jgi:hypothetical protein
MSRRDRSRPGRLAALQDLLEAGDHRAAREEARRIGADPAVSANERSGAASVVSGLAPEPGAVAVGVSALVAAVLLVAWIVLSAS